MNKDIIIKIATDFSRIPGARYPEEGGLFRSRI